MTPFAIPKRRALRLETCVVWLVGFASLLVGVPRATGHEPLPQVLAELDQRNQLAPTNPRNHLQRAELRRLAGDLAGALDDLDTALALEPLLSESHLFRGRVLLEAGDPAAALEALDRFLAESPEGSTETLRPLALSLRTRALRRLGRVDEALETLDATLRSAPHPGPELYLERARLVAGRLLEEQLGAGPDGGEDRRRLESALRGLDEGLARLGPVVPLVTTAIDLELRLGRPAAALARLDGLIRRAGRTDRWLERRGEVLLAAGDPRAAAGSFAAALAEIARLPDGRRRAPATAARRERLLRALRRFGDAGTGASVDEALSGGEGSIITRQEAPARPPSGARAVGGMPAQLTRGPYLQQGTPTGAVVRWRTDLAADTWLAWGPAPDQLTQSLTDPRLVTEHEVQLSGLEPTTLYFYAVGTTQQILAGGDADHFLRTSPSPGTPTPARVWVVGDSGTGDAYAAAVRDAFLTVTGGERPDVWLMLGDNAYPTGTDGDYQSAVFDLYPTLLRNTFLWSVVGNHDALSADSPTQSGPYFDIFTLPMAAQAGGLPSGTEAYYSFDWGDIHFVCLDSSDSDRSPQGAMIQWLTADLDSTPRSWIVAAFHHPPYTKGSHDSDDPADSAGRLFDMRQIALSVLEAHGVDLVLSGHSHSYERSFLLDGHYGTSDTLEPATMILDAGDGRPGGDGAYRKVTPAHGGAIYVVAGSSGRTGGGTLDHPAMFVGLAELGSLVLDFAGDRVDATFLDVLGQARDTFTLQRAPSPIFSDGFESGDTSAWSATAGSF